MKTENPENANPSHPVQRSRSRRLEKALVCMVSLYAGLHFTGFTLGWVMPGEADVHWYLRFVMMSLINWFIDLLYERYRGV